MGRGPKQTFLRGRHTDGQEAPEKMFNITNNYRNAYQRYEILPHTSKNGYHPKKKNPQTTNAREGVERRESSYTVGGSVNWYSHCSEQYGVSLKK